MQEEEPAERMKYGAFARTESLRSLPCLEEELARVVGDAAAVRIVGFLRSGIRTPSCCPASAVALRVPV